MLTAEATPPLKHNNTGKALNVARMEPDIHGGNDIVDKYHVVRW
jgi:hypothetical protein